MTVRQGPSSQRQERRRQNRQVTSHDRRGRNIDATVQDAVVIVDSDTGDFDFEQQTREVILHEAPLVAGTRPTTAKSPRLEEGLNKNNDDDDDDGNPSSSLPIDDAGNSNSNMKNDESNITSIINKNENKKHKKKHKKKHVDDDDDNDEKDSVQLLSIKFVAIAAMILAIITGVVVIIFLVRNNNIKNKSENGPIDDTSPSKAKD